ncbi:MAG: RloB family protein [Candidatus Cloacimonetes bacterium]|nr:RloB family protein [Candidatus Cloacimonadota bacterium]
MGSDDLFRKRKASELTRKSESERVYSNSILIVCEGKKTEPNYFKGFQVSGVVVEIIGLGNNTDFLVRDAVEIWKDYANDGKYYEHLWCVFDHDDFPQENYNQAFVTISTEQEKLNKRYEKKVGRKIQIKIAYSNEAFELWYLLHYDYHTSGISRSRFKAMLTKKMGKKYKKNDTGMYDFLQELSVNKNGAEGQRFAIENAKRLRVFHNCNDPQNHNPCTNVDELVEELNLHLKK